MTTSSIEVECPGRLHLGFIDPSGTHLRRFGGLGLALEGVSTRLRLARAGVDSAVAANERVAAELPRIQARLRQLRAALDFHEPLALDVREALLSHAGLGSGTQLTLALGVALARLAGRRLGAREIAALGGRGGRSGIGVAAFEQGGFVVDGGRGPLTHIPPLVARLAFPPAWRVILLFDAGFSGLHGDGESDAFRKLPGFPPERSAELAHLCLTTVLPALAEGDFPSFGSAITEIQATVGLHFAPMQGGLFASPSVARWLDWFAGEGAVCYGQSSWGPTGFVIVPSVEEADQRLAAALRLRMPLDPVRFMSVPARNAGGGVVESSTGSPPLRVPS